MNPLVASWSSYWLGVATVPALALAGFLGFVAWVRLGMLLNERGFTFEVRGRGGEGPSDFTLRRTIWFERSRGPLAFTGHWYRQEPRFEEPEPVFVTRWIGLGPIDGPNISFFHKRLLGHEHTVPRTDHSMTSVGNRTKGDPHDQRAHSL